MPRVGGRGQEGRAWSGRTASLIQSFGYSCSVQWPRDVYKSKTAWVTTSLYLEAL